MPNELPGNDPQNLWQHQPTEAFSMPVNEIRRKAEKHYRKTRLMMILGITIGIVMGGFFAVALARTPWLLTRIGYGLLSLWSFYFAGYVARAMRPGRPPQNAPAATSLAFYRGELERRRDYLRGEWARSGLPVCFLGLALIVVPGLMAALSHAPAQVVHAAPLLVLLILWFVMYSSLRKRQGKTLQQEIDELRALERENRS